MSVHIARTKDERNGYAGRMTVGFLTHPLGERDADWGSARGNNLANAMLWFRFLKDATRWAICFPAMAYIAAVDDIWHRPSMITDAVEIMERCDVLIVVGDHISPHMRIEIAHARGMTKPIPVIDLIDLGSSPPFMKTDETASEIRRRAAALGL
jgi:hypothetical protein